MSDSNDITVLNPGLYKNLLAQVEAIYKHSNELSFKTRAKETEGRFSCLLRKNQLTQSSRSFPTAF